MSDEKPQDGCCSDPLDELLEALGSAVDPTSLLARAWGWFNKHAGVDVLNVATLGPPEPTGYVFSVGQLQTEEDIVKSWDVLVEAAAEVCPDRGAHPRRRGDRRLWNATEEHMALEPPPTPIGKWIVTMAGGPSVLVMPTRGSDEPVSDECEAILAQASRYIGLYLRGVEALYTQPQAAPGPDTPFEEQLEYEVQRAQRQRTAVSLALVEYRLAGATAGETSVPDEVRERVSTILSRTTRGNDRVAQIGESCLAVIMPKTDAPGALVGADRLQRSLLAELEGSEPELSIRVGIGGRDPAETGASELFARASQALAQSRSSHGEAAFLYV